MIGTFFLVLTIGCTVIDGGAGVIPPLAIGAALEFSLERKTPDPKFVRKKKK